MKKYWSLIFILIGLTVGCGGPRSFVHPATDIGYYKKLGVVPFQNLTSDVFAGQKLTSTFITELLLTKKFEVAEPGEFERIVAEVLQSGPGSDKQELSADQVKSIGDKTGVQGLIEGEVKDFQMTRIGTEEFPLISLSVKLIDVSSGQVVWMSSYSAKGGPKFPIFSFGETRTLGELSQKVCQKVVQEFIAQVF